MYIFSFWVYGDIYVSAKVVSLFNSVFAFVFVCVCVCVRVCVLVYSKYTLSTRVFMCADVTEYKRVYTIQYSFSFFNTLFFIRALKKRKSWFLRILTGFCGKCPHLTIVYSCLRPLPICMCLCLCVCVCVCMNLFIKELVKVYPENFPDQISFCVNMMHVFKCRILQEYPAKINE